MPLRRTIKKTINEYHAFYKATIESEDYKKYREMRIAELEKDGLIEDLGDTSVHKIVFCDVLSNKDISNLLSRIYSLDKLHFKCSHNYKKPKLINNYSYIHLKNGSMSSGIFEEIQLINDPFVKSINIHWSQINNYYAFLEYNIEFKKCLSDDEIGQFIDTNINQYSSKDFVSVYKKRNDSVLNYIDVDSYIYNRFIELCQHYITTYFYSKYAKNYQLPHLTWVVSNKKFDIKTLIKENSFYSYYNKESNYLISKEIGSYGYQLLSQNNNIPAFSPCSCVMKYGLAFYYTFFGRYELDLFNAEFTKYSSNEKALSYNKLISLLNRAQGLNEEYDYEKLLNDDFNKKWAFFVGDKEEQLSFDISFYKSIFNNSFSYFKTTNDFYSTRLNKVISIIALVVSLVGLAIAIVTIFLS